MSRGQIDASPYHGRQPDLVEVIEMLRHDREQPSLPTDPLHHVLWENMGYLITDSQRAGLFADFGREIGFEAGAILAAEEPVLLSLAKRGGMRPQERVERWRTCAAIVADHCGGGLEATLRSLPFLKARALLKRFPGIGDPGADKILLFSGIEPRPSVDTNGLRSLVRLGFISQQKSYRASYRAGAALLGAQGKQDREWLCTAYLALRAHGKSLCRRNQPLCHECPLDDLCAHAAADQF